MPRALLLLLMGCVPAYHAPSHHAPIFDGGKQFNGRAALGFGGLQVQAAYAPVNHIAIRTSLQGFADIRGTYGLGGAGFEVFHAFDNPFRIAVGLEVHAGVIHKLYPARNELFIDRPEVEVKGLLLQAALPFTVAWEWDTVATGITGRGLLHTHPSRPSWSNLDAGPRGNVFSGEVAWMLRWGGGKVKGDLQLGLAIPLVEFDGGDRASLPFNAALGIVVDL